MHPAAYIPFLAGAFAVLFDPLRLGYYLVAAAAFTLLIDWIARRPTPAMAVRVDAPHPDDLIVWPDYEWCYRHELGAFGHKSDDYHVVRVDGLSYQRALTFLEDY